MKTRLIVVFGIAAMVAAAPAFAVTINDPWEDPGGAEWNLYQIWNYFYGAETGDTYASSQDLWDDRGIVDRWYFTWGQDTQALAQARYAGFTQEFGYFTQGTDTTDPSNLSSMFQVVDTGLSPATVATGGYTIPIGAMPVGFWDNSPIGGSNYWFSDPSLNTHPQEVGVVHMVAFQIDANRVLLAFEDLPTTAADWDFNDLVVEVGIPTPIPEPGTFALLGLGLAGFMIRRRFWL